MFEFFTFLCRSFQSFEQNQMANCSCDNESRELLPSLYVVLMIIKMALLSLSFFPQHPISVRDETLDALADAQVSK